LFYTYIYIFFILYIYITKQVLHIYPFFIIYFIHLILLLYKDKAGFCLYALNKKTTQSIGTKLIYILLFFFNKINEPFLIKITSLITIFCSIWFNLFTYFFSFSRYSRRCSQFVDVFDIIFMIHNISLLQFRTNPFCEIKIEFCIR